MSNLDIIIIVILLLCMIMAIYSIRKDKCHDCTHCHKECRRDNYGKKLKEDFKD